MASWIPKVGLVVGTEGGDLLVQTEGGFEPITGEREVFSVIAARPVDDGMLVGGQFRLVQYHPTLGFCGADTTGAHIRAMISSGDDVLLLTKDAFLTETDVTLYVYRRTNRRPECLADEPENVNE